jgi:hypothetical protein
MGQPQNRRSGGDHLTGLGENRADDPVSVRGERCIARGVARQCDRALRPREGAPRLIGSRFALVDVGGRGPALELQRSNSPLLGLLLVERALGRGIVGVGLLNLQTQIAIVEPGQGIAFPDNCASVDKPLGEFAGDAEGKVALDPGLHHAGQHAVALTGRVVDFRNQNRAFGRLSFRLRRRAAAGERQSRQQGEDDRTKRHDA